MNSRHKRLRCSLVLLAPALVAFASATARGQGNLPPLKQPTTIVKLYPLKFADAGETAKLVESLFKDTKLQVAVEARTNSLVVRATPDVQKSVEELIRKIDTPKPAAGQMKPPVTVYPLQTADAGEVAKTLEALLPDGTFRVVIDKRSNALYVRASPSFAKLAENLIKTLDRSDLPEIKIFTLANGVASELLPAVSQLIGRDVKIIADPRTNSLIATGPKNRLTVLEAIVMRMDQQKRDKKPTIRSIPVRFAAASDVVNALARLNTNASIAADPTRNLVLINSDAATYQSLEETIFSIDKAAALDAQPQQVRIVWLVSGLDKKNAPPPADLKDVIDELGKIGVKDLKLAAQSVVTTVTSAGGTQFMTQGRTTLKTPTQLDVTGQISRGKENNFTMEVSIQAREIGKAAAGAGGVGVAQPPGGGRRRFRSSGSTNLCSINTSVTAPPGHAVVLGVTPIDSMNSVFVIQVLPKKTKKK